MASTSSHNKDAISIKVDISGKGGSNTVDLNNISSSMTIGALKAKLRVQPNARFGRLDQFENWDNRCTLSDYFVKSGESFECVVQCVIEDGQSTFDDYNEWLAAYKQQ